VYASGIDEDQGLIGGIKMKGHLFLLVTGISKKHHMCFVLNCDYKGKGDWSEHPSHYSGGLFNIKKQKEMELLMNTEYGTCNSHS
jgi:hypothetical protein